jgi:ligand-binding SRPBCC domain-containing protein
VNTYEKTSLIECKVDELFFFHLDTSNLKAISPKNIKVSLLNEGFVPKEGAVLKLRTVKNFVPIIWEVKIESLDAPNLLVDVAIKSPFKFWKHSHMFKQVDENLCELKDIVEYSLPFGFLGSLFNGFVKKELDSMFEFRHAVTKKMIQG